MNLELLDSYGHNFPEEADGNLDCGSIALTCRFNRWGSLLSVGCNDGRVMIFDFTTRGIAKVLSAHVQPVASLSWNRNGRRLATASSDYTLAVWDVLTGECCNRFRFTSLIMKVQFHPRNDNNLLVCPLKSSAVMLNVKDGSTSIIPCDDDSPEHQITAAAYDRRGKYIITGTSKGNITILDANLLELVVSFRVQTTHPVRLVEVSARGGNYFLTSSNDRVIKIYDLDDIILRRTGSTEPIQKLQDLVNKTPWKVCCFSGDSEYVCAGSGRAHALYIWERNTGCLVKILHGIKGETLLDVVWHPFKPLICSISNGLVSVWSQTHVENWSAFAPDFKELDENVEYEERESEFDVEDDDKSVEMNAEKPSEDIEVDVVTIGSSSLLYSSDEEAEPADALWYLPIAPDIDDPEEPPVGYVLPPESQQQQSSSISNVQNIPPSPKKPSATNIVDVSLPTPRYHQTDAANSATSGRKKPAVTQPRQKRKNKNNDGPYK